MKAPGATPGATNGGPQASPPQAPGGVALILDEKPICRMAISRLLLDAQMVADARLAGDLARALEAIAAKPPRLLILDLFTLGYDFDLLRAARAAAPQSRAIVIDDRVNPAFAQRAMEVGAQGYVAKNYEPAQLLEAVRAVLAGDQAFPSGVHGGRKPGAGSPHLSPRQLEVLTQMALGKTSREIAATLGIKLGTVKLHSHAILKITGARNRTEAALLAPRFLAPR